MTRAKWVAAGVGLAALAGLAADGLATRPRAPGTTVSAPGPGDPMGEATARLIGAALLSRRAYADLADLCDRIGNRLAGSEALDRAVAWSVERMRAAGLEGVRAEDVTVPVWVRGEERATLLHPLERRLPMLGLGGSVGTPHGGIEAEVVVARDFAHLESLGEAARGRIVLFDVPFTDYGETVAYRGKGASAAARLGAAAVLIRSVTPTSLSTPHTGALGYADDALRANMSETVTPSEMTEQGVHWTHHVEAEHEPHPAPGRRS